MNTNFSFNHAGSPTSSLAQGGAVWTTWDMVSVSNGAWHDNSAGGDPAGPPIGQGGALHAAGDVLLEFVSLRHNAVDGDGGAAAVMAPGPTSYLGEPLLTIHNSVIEDNRAGDSQLGRSGSGGGIFSSAVLDIVGASIARNVASEAGGGIALVEDATPSSAHFNLVGFVDNQAHSMHSMGGGGLFSDLSSIDLETVNFNSNVAGLENPVEGLVFDGPGGGLDLRGDAVLLDVQFVSNRSVEEAGGGIHCDGPPEPGLAESRLQGSQLFFSKNKAWAVDPYYTGPGVRSFGGGLSAEQDCDAEVLDSEFRANEAVYGGGISVRSTEFAGRNLHVYDHGLASAVPPWSGAGFFLNAPRRGDSALFMSAGNDALITISNSTFETNHAQWAGGGANFRCRGSSGDPLDPSWDVLLDHTEFIRNEVVGVAATGLDSPDGGGAVAILDCLASLQGGGSGGTTWWRFNEAPTGGALRLAYAASLLQAAPPSGRYALGTYSTGIAFGDNFARVKGGAIHSDGSRLVVKGGAIVRNSAAELGGGLSTAGNASNFNIVTITETSVSLNTAGVGGGAVWFEGEELHLTNDLFAANASPLAAVYATNSSPWVPGLTHMFTANKVTVAGNHSLSGIGPFQGLVLEDQDPAGLSVSGSLDDSVVAMNETPSALSTLQADGLGFLTVSNLLLFAHSPVETDPALLCDDPTGSFGANPLFLGGDVTLSSATLDDPWTGSNTYYDFHGEPGGPVGPLAPGGRDEIGAFMGNQGGWCDGLVETWCTQP